ncbi:snaclec flavocetin-A subunit beta-like [Mercenaria mercenaria]|uniref:snaclec flavocetin-A subunit beta-like n=1 Tax=Mercenaria mercenaria TaxID=6596 RepID=UPI00234E6088|nr:snaclec flavocetin-A subunit beta-like [Mercenaria mercenaria]
MTITRLLALFLYGTFAYVIAVTNFTEFIKYEDLGGFTCPSDQVVFDDKDKGSLVQCVLQCSKTSTCYGVFHVEENMRCVGCKDKFLTNASAPFLNGTEYYRRRTYRLITQRMGWADAKKHCEDLGGYLAVIKSQEEQSYIDKYLDKYFTNADSYQYIWIGASRDEREVYLWQDGTKVSDGYSNWRPEESKYGGFRCIYLKYDGEGWVWKDYSCFSAIFSLCEYD